MDGGTLPYSVTQSYKVPLAQPLLNFAYCQKHVCMLNCCFVGRGIVWEASEREIGKRVPLVWAFFQQASRTCIILCQNAALKEMISRKVQSEHVLLFVSEQIWVNFELEGCNVWTPEQVAPSAT